MQVPPKEQELEALSQIKYILFSGAYSEICEYSNGIAAMCIVSIILSCMAQNGSDMSGKQDCDFE